MRCDYCGRKIRPEEKKEHEVSVSVSGGKKNDFSNGWAFKNYYCCSYECRVKLFDRILGALYEDESQREHAEETDDLPERTQRKKPPRITVSDVALAISIFALVFQIFCHIILPRLI